MTYPNPQLIEPRFKAALDRYVEAMLPTGGFLKAVLENNLMETVHRADPGGLCNLPHIVSYVYNELPSGVWGTPERVEKWLALRAAEVGA